MFKNTNGEAKDTPIGSLMTCALIGYYNTIHNFTKFTPKQITKCILNCATPTEITASQIVSNYVNMKKKHPNYKQNNKRKQLEMSFSRKQTFIKYIDILLINFNNTFRISSHLEQMENLKFYKNGLLIPNLNITNTCCLIFS